ncbi:hypothetical protein JHL21_15585 [Devosia sp. WQ 349]|uniref:hypothetical protein n=1 Tax=Devosia sp. WQ 349K1 TaxID=2800329 RepID=UPI001905195D|nr:hypothetical protein [Devosia sp. WQ 349K1]MBK1795915.1 hypothetical protein [Devosia sp. WQ 349K1]
MSIRGPQALASLEEAMRDIRREEDEISRRVARTSERITKLREAEAEYFRQLAKLRLDPKIQAELDGEITAAERKARDVLKGHARDVTMAETSLKAIEDNRSKLLEHRSAALRLLEDKQENLTALTAKLAQQIASDPQFIAKRQETEELDHIAEEALKKTEQAEADREAKGKPYRDDPLFIYLWDAGYGTSTYKASGLTRYLDGLVSRLIGFTKARPNYHMLNELPLRLREHAELQEENVRAAEAELAALEVAAIDAAGGAPLRDAVETTKAEITKLDEQVVALEDQRDAAANALRSLAEGEDPEFVRAATDLAAALAREDIRTLLAEARRTRTAQDDTIVGQIDETRTRLGEEETESKEQRARLKTLAERRRELEDIQWEFKKQHFDDPGSSFSQDRLVGDMLTEFLKGGISAAAYWDQWRKSQNWAPGSEWGSGYKSTRRAGSNKSPWGNGGGWPDSSIGGGAAPRKPTPGGFGGAWGGGLGGGSAGGGFSRPRGGGSAGGGLSSGNRKSSSGFKTGGRF